MSAGPSAPGGTAIGGSIPPAERAVAAPRLFIVAHLHRYEATGAGGMRNRLERMRRMRELGFVGTRLAFEWNLLEPEPGEYDWAQQDRIVAELEENGLSAYGVLVFTPEWARPRDTPRSHRPVIHGSAGKGDSAFAAFAAAAARRYRGRVDGWEIWNEPNIRHFWQHLENGTDLGIDPGDYLSLFVAARDSIHAVNPEATVITAGLAHGPGEAFRQARIARGEIVGLPGHLFLRALLEQGLRPEDVGFHPYTDEPILWPTDGGRAVNPGMREIERVLDEFGLDSTRIWVTEWGVDRMPDRSGDVVSEWMAAGLSALACDSRVEMVTIFALTHHGGRSSYGLVDGAGNGTSAMQALGTTLEGWIGCP